MSWRTGLMVGALTVTGLVQGLYQVGDPIDRETVTPGRVIFVTAAMLVTVGLGYLLAWMDIEDRKPKGGDQ